MNDPILERLVIALRPIEEVAALALGGSRARGTAGPRSDYDVGLYYHGCAPFDLERLQAAIAPLLDDPVRGKLTPPGGWGPWINGGGWLSVSGQKVDLIYRDLTQVGSIIAGCKVGRISMDYQPGHPHGFCSAIYMGEIALCRPLFDRRDAIAELKSQVWPFPAALREALINRFHWEVLFSIENADVAINRDEQTHIAGCVYRALCCIAQVLFAVNGRYLINEKGAMNETEIFPITLEGSAGIVAGIWAAIAEKDFRAALQLLRQMANELDRIVDHATAK